MNSNLSKADLVEIADQLAEFIAGYTGFLSWAKGEVEPEEAPPNENQPWRAPFILFAGRGRVEIYRQVLSEHKFALDPYFIRFIEQTDEELEEWLADNYNRTADLLEEAHAFLVEAYRDGYRKKESGKIGWDFDDFIEERDLLEFFLIGVGDRFPMTDLSVDLFNIDCEIRERIAELGLENYEDEFFPGRIPWFPQRFWWHHRPENRVQHPDSLEA
jgi:hypothetical protein